MSFENTAHKTKKLKVEENMLAFLEECKKVNYYYTMYIIIDSNMTSCYHGNTFISMASIFDIKSPANI